MEIDSSANVVRGRPREFDPDLALAAALRVFWTRGYDGASLAELTEAMGIARPSLYACFGNKEALFRKALDLYEKEKLGYIRDALAAPTAKGVAERLLRGALSSHADGDPDGCLGVISTMPSSAESGTIRAEVIARRARSDAALVARFEEALQQGDLPAGMQAEALAHYLDAILQGLCVQAGSGASHEELGRMVDTALAVWPGR